MIGSKSQYEEDGYTTRVYGGYTENTKLLDKGFEGYKPVEAEALEGFDIHQENTFDDGKVKMSKNQAKHSDYSRDFSSWEFFIFCFLLGVLLSHKF